MSALTLVLIVLGAMFVGAALGVILMWHWLFSAFKWFFGLLNKDE